MTVGNLIEMLGKLNPSTRVYTCGEEGVYVAEGGNLFPLKILETEFGVGLYIDDGLTCDDEIVDQWVPLDEYVGWNGGLVG